MNLEIRPYDTRDAGGANAVARAAFAQYAPHYDDWPAFIERIGRLAELASEGDLLVAEQGGTVIGAVLHVPPGRPRSAIFPLEWSVVRMLVVAPEARGQGAGRRLMAACLRCARDAGAPAVTLHTSPVMAAALRMYESIGFVRDRDIAPIQGVAYGRYMLPAARIAQALAALEMPRD
jgi:GNAT superfamily N-acetyltransferase